MFKVKKDEKSLNLSSEELFRNILKTIFLEEKNEKIKDVKTFVKTLNDLTQSKLLNMSFSQLLEIYFMAGYYYRIFLEKNNVEFTCKERDESS